MTEPDELTFNARIALRAVVAQSIAGPDTAPSREHMNAAERLIRAGHIDINRVLDLP